MELSKRNVSETKIINLINTTRIYICVIDLSFASRAVGSKSYVSQAHLAHYSNVQVLD